MATIALVETADTISTGVGDVVTVSASVDTGARPVFYSPDSGRRLAADIDDLGIWTASWATSRPGDFAIRIEAPLAAPVVVLVEVTGDGPPAPDYYGTPLLDQAFDARDAAVVARNATYLARDESVVARNESRLARDAAQTARDAAQAAILADLGVTDGQLTAILNTPTSQGAQKVAALIETSGVGRIMANAAPLRNVAAKTRTGALRVGLVGTSISNFDNAALRVAAHHLTAVYGNSGAQHLIYGIFGGSFDLGGATGWSKQHYGGPLFGRMVSTSPTAATLRHVVYGDSITLRTSRETDAGAFEVRIDGVSQGTVGGPGAQAYNQVTTYTTTLGTHTVEILPPASGRAYLESLTTVTQARAGVDLFDYTRGSTALANMTTLLPKSTNQLDGIPIVGQNGIDAFFARDDIDLWMVSTPVNDGGTTEAQFIANTTKAVELTAARGVPIVFVIEPMHSYSTRTDYQRMRKHLLSLASNGNVTVIDWHGALYTPADVPGFQARYWPGADKTHPNQASYDVLAGMLATALNVTPSPYTTVPAVRSARASAFNGIDGANKTVVIEGTPRALVLAEGISGRALVTDATDTVITRQPYYRYPLTVNRGLSTQNAIRDSVTSDAYGKYIDTAGLTIYMDFFTNNVEQYLLTVKFGEAQALIVRTASNYRMTGPTGEDLPVTDTVNSITQLRALASGAPRVVTVGIRRSIASPQNLTIIGRIYDLTITKSDVPVFGVFPT